MICTQRYHNLLYKLCVINDVNQTKYNATQILIITRKLQQLQLSMQDYTCGLVLCWYFRHHAWLVLVFKLKVQIPVFVQQSNERKTIRLLDAWQRWFRVNVLAVQQLIWLGAISSVTITQISVITSTSSTAIQPRIF